MILDHLGMYAMDSRLLQLERTLTALRETGVPLVMDTNGFWGAAGFTDDDGLYYFVPKIALALGLTARQALSLFLGSLISVGWLSGALGFFALFKEWPSRLVAAVGLFLLARMAWMFSDVYVLQMFMAVAFAPWVLAAVERKKASWLVVIAFLAGFVGSYANQVRSHSGTTLWVFLALCWGLASMRGRLKVLALGAFLLGCLIPALHMRSLEARRDAFLASKVPGFRAQDIYHPLWHSVYIGFGYLPNPYGVTYSDTCAAEKVRSVDPSIPYCSLAYDKVLGQATREFVAAHPLFALKTFAHKGLVLAGYVLLFVNVGWFFLYRAYPGWRVVLPFVAAILFGALPGLMVIPSKPYVLGMISFAALLGITSIGLGVRGHRVGKEG